LTTYGEKWEEGKKGLRRNQFSGNLIRSCLWGLWVYLCMQCCNHRTKELRIWGHFVRHIDCKPKTSPVIQLAATRAESPGLRLLSEATMYSSINLSKTGASTIGTWQKKTNRCDAVLLCWKDENNKICTASADPYPSDALYFLIETISFTINNTIMKNRIRKFAILLTVHATRVYGSSRLHIKWVPVRHTARYYRALTYYKAPVFFKNQQTRNIYTYCTFSNHPHIHNIS